MAILLFKSLKAIQVSRPGLVENPKFYVKMSGSDWGVGDMYVLAAPFDLSKSMVDYPVPSGKRGRSKPEWIQTA
jgi:hypothetical protein